jgi:hypothetical protein
MTLDEVYRSVVAFLDQFIERGASEDVLDLRRRLVSDRETRLRLEAEMPNQEPTEREAFDGMRGLLAVEEERTRGQFEYAGGPNLVLLLSWTSWEQWAGKATGDPAQWHDWLRAVQLGRRS